MTAEFGPRGADLSTTERVGARSIELLVRFMNWKTLDDKTLRFRTESATFVVSGESEVSGEAYARGKRVAAVCIAAGILPIVALLSLGPAVTNLPAPLDAVGSWLLLLSMVLALVNLSGALDVFEKADVIDHTTEPEPERLTELQDAYVAGDIDGDELEAEVEAVIDS